MVNRIILISSLAAIVIILVMLNFTTPASIGPLGVLVFFTTFYILMFGLAVGMMHLFYHMMGRRKKWMRSDYLYAIVIAFGPIMILLMQAFGSMSLLTLGLVVFFVSLACFLIKKRFSVVK